MCHYSHNSPSTQSMLSVVPDTVNKSQVLLFIFQWQAIVGISFTASGELYCKWVSLYRGQNQCMALGSN